MYLLLAIIVITVSFLWIQVRYYQVKSWLFPSKEERALGKKRGSFPWRALQDGVLSAILIFVGFTHPSLAVILGGVGASISFVLVLQDWLGLHGTKKHKEKQATAAKAATSIAKPFAFIKHHFMVGWEKEDQRLKNQHLK